jgi:hypothetical protein
VTDLAPIQLGVSTLILLANVAALVVMLRK